MCGLPAVCGRTVPPSALKIEKNRCTLRESANWSSDAVRGDLEAGRHRRRAALLHGQSQASCRSTGTGCCSTPPRSRTRSIDPLREPMETRVFLGKKPGAHPARRSGAADHGADAAAGAVHAGDVLRHELRLHQLSTPTRAWPGRRRRWGSATTPVRADSTRTFTAMGATPSSRWRPAGSAFTRTT